MYWYTAQFFPTGSVIYMEQIFQESVHTFNFEACLIHLWSAELLVMNIDNFQHVTDTTPAIYTHIVWNQSEYIYITACLSKAISLPRRGKAMPSCLCVCVCVRQQKKMFS